MTQWPYGGIQGKFFRIASPTYVFARAPGRIMVDAAPTAEMGFGRGLSGIIAFVWTILFFLPILRKTQVTQGAGLSGEEITALVTQFRAWNWGRWAVLIGGWIAGLRASVSVHRKNRPDEGDATIYGAAFPRAPFLGLVRQYK